MGEVQFFIKIPIFVARQYIRHRTQNLNEYSARYSEMSNDFYMPPLERMQKQSKSNKQMSAGQLDETTAQELLTDIDSINITAYSSYKKALSKGLSRELARIQLPVSNFTEMYTKMNLRNFFHLVSLRDDPGHAQDEIVSLASIMYSLVKPHFPLACEAFEDYHKNAVTLSKQEMDIIRMILNEKCNKENLLESVQFDSLSEKEQAEFKQKLQWS